MSGIVIVGAGHAGVQLAASLRDVGFTQEIRLFSADPDHPYHKPPLSKSFMKTPDAALQHLRGQSFFSDKSITLELGAEIVAIDRDNKQIVTADNRQLSYDKLVLATGTRARRLMVPGVELPGVYSLRTATDARLLRAALPDCERVVVIGGGFIGLEAAAMLRARGAKVDVVEVAARLLGRAASGMIADAVADSLQADGVGLRMGENVLGINAGAGAIASVALDNTELQADLVLIGVGAEPMDELAAAAGLAVDNGIVVDKYLATDDPDIFAIGDCVAFPQPHIGRQARLESVQNATDQARALAHSLNGAATEYSALPWFWSDIGALKLQIAGLIEGADETIPTRAEDGKIKSVYHLKNDRLVATETLNSAAEHMLSRRLIADGVTPSRDILQSGDPALIKKAWRG